MQYHDDELRAMIAQKTMTAELWRAIGPGQRERVRDESEMCEELRGLEGCRVEATHYGERVRFQVGRSTGWRPVHLRLHNVRSMGGEAITRGTVSDVRIVRRAR